MFTYLRNMRIKAFANFLIAVMLIAGAVVAAASLSTIAEVNATRDAWSEFDTGPARKTAILSDLRGAIGFGGLIHEFKNAVLRREKENLKTAEKAARAALAAIANYRALGLTADETNALATVERTIQEFATQFPVAAELIDRGLAVGEIDNVVRIGDRSAVDALETLDVLLRSGREAAANQVFDAVRRAQLFTYVTLAIVAALIVLLIGLFLWFARSRVIQPIYTLMDFVNHVGAGDLTRQIDDVSEDEVGTLGQRLNEMVVRLKEITVQTRAAVANLNSVAAETLASTKQQAASVEQQFAAIQETTATLEEISQSGQQMSTRAKDIAGQAEAASERSKDGLKAVDDLARIMDAIEQQTEAVAEHIVTLSEKTQAIGEIIASVNDIAERSQLLALNAAIEAAAAGEQGRTFSVVAEEIKTLADQAKAATNQVSSILGQIQKGINASVMSTEESVKRVANGREQSENTLKTISDLVGTIDRSLRAFEQVVASTNQQRVGLEQVAQALQQIRTGSEQTAAGTKQIEIAVLNINTLGSQLDRSMERFAV
jgi:methyl-accepting chemotaxis protein